MQYNPTDAFKVDVNLKAFNTLSLNANAKNYFKLSDINQLASLNLKLQEIKDYLILGGGSNVVLSPQISQLIIHVQLKGIQLLHETDEYFLIQVGAGENWHNFVSYCLDQGWYGLENLALIPGTVGAAPVQNIGAYGIEIESFCESVQAYNLQTQKKIVLSKEDCQFSYRDSYFKKQAKDLLITRVEFKLPKKWQANLSYPDLNKHPELQGEHITPKMIFDAVCEIRNHKLPNPEKIANAGSFFKNPIITKKQLNTLQLNYPEIPFYPYKDKVKIAAAWLIDQSGWKGFNDGVVGVHPRQALVIINVNNASYQDIKELANKIQNDVWKKFQIELEPEPIFIKSIQSDHEFIA